MDAIDQAIDDIVKEQDKFLTHVQLAASLQGLAGRIDADILEVADSVADVETRLAKAFNEALEEEGTTRDEAIAAAVAQVTNDLGITREELLETINTEDVRLDTRITTVRDRLQKQINTLRDNVWNSIGNLNSRISANDITDAQLEAEIDALAEELGTTREDIYDLLDTNTTELNALNKEVSDLETDLNAKIDANQQAGMERDDAMAKAIADIVAESEDFTTHAEVAEYLSDYRTGEEITAEIQTVADSVTELEERLVALINANTDADLSDTEKLDQAIADLAADLGVDIDTIFSRLGAAADARQKLDTRITTVRDNINARITRVRNQLQEQINANRRAGMDEDAALQAAIDKVAGDLDTTEQGILDQLGTTREALEADIAGLQTQVDDITAQINDLMNQGVSFDDALAQIAGDLQTTEDALLAQMGKDKQELSDEIDTLRSQVSDVQAQLGDVEGQIAELMNQGATFDEALAQIAGDLQTTEDALLVQMGKDKQELSDDIDTLRTQLGDVEGQIAELMNQGATFDEALAQIAGDLQTTEDALLTQMGKDKQELSDDIDTLRTQLGGIEGQIAELMSQGDTFEDALAKVSADLNITKGTLLARLNKTEQELSADITALTAQLGDVQSQIAELMDQGATFEEALAEVASRQQLDKAELLRSLDTTEQALSSDIDVLRGQVGDVQTQLGDVQGQITTLMQQGATFEEALAQVAGDLQTTEDTLLAQMGTDKEALEAQIGTVQTQVTDLGTTLNNRIDELEAQTGDRDAAITQAINELAEQQGTDTATLLAQLEAQREESEAAALLLGKPTREVTQDDIDAANAYLDSVADIEASQRPVPTAEEMLYDVNADGVIDDTDLALLQGAFAGQDVEFAADSVFGPATGLYAELEAVQAQNEALAQQQQEAQQEAQRQQEIQQQQQIEQQRQQQEQDIRERLEQEQQRLMQPRQVAPTDPIELAQIDYLFDVYGDEIFATPQQKELFTSPYGARTDLPQKAAKGGMIERNDELLRLIGD